MRISIRGESHIDSSHVILTLMGGWINLCDAKKINSKYQCFEKKKQSWRCKLKEMQVFNNKKSKLYFFFITTAVQALVSTKSRGVIGTLTNIQDGALCGNK